MPKTETKLAELTRVLAAHAPGCNGMAASHVAALARELRRLAKKAHRHATAQCNRETSEAEELADQRNDLLIRALCALLWIEPVFSGDPRGCVVHIRFPGKDAPYNTWGGAERGWGIS